MRQRTTYHDEQGTIDDRDEARADRRPRPGAGCAEAGDSGWLFLPDSLYLDVAARRVLQ